MKNYIYIFIYIYIYIYIFKLHFLSQVIFKTFCILSSVSKCRVSQVEPKENAIFFISGESKSFCKQTISYFFHQYFHLRAV